MFEINIIYIIFSLSIDKETNQYNYLILLDESNNLPSIQLQNNQTLIDTREKCIQKYIPDIKITWIDDKLLDIEANEHSINVYYTCNMSTSTKIQNGQFHTISTEKIISPIIQKALSRV